MVVTCVIKESHHLYDGSKSELKFQTLSVTDRMCEDEHLRVLNEI